MNVLNSIRSYCVLKISTECCYLEGFLSQKSYPYNIPENIDITYEWFIATQKLLTAIRILSAFPVGENIIGAPKMQNGVWYTVNIYNFQFGIAKVVNLFAWFFNHLFRLVIGVFSVMLPKQLSIFRSNREYSQYWKT